MSAEDERFSFKAARGVMVLLSAVSILAYILSVNPFAISFNVSFVYLPTAVLIVGPFLTRALRKTDSSS